MFVLTIAFKLESQDPGNDIIGVLYRSIEKFEQETIKTAVKYDKLSLAPILI